jgi:hypothetical protein
MPSTLAAAGAAYTWHFRGDPPREQKRNATADLPLTAGQLGWICPRYAST